LIIIEKTFDELVHETVLKEIFQMNIHLEKFDVLQCRNLSQKNLKEKEFQAKIQEMNNFDNNTRLFHLSYSLGNIKNFYEENCVVDKLFF
jgi:hypothetical protein